MFNITRYGQMLWETSDRDLALVMTRRFRSLERKFHTFRPIVMDRVS